MISYTPIYSHGTNVYNLEGFAPPVVDKAYLKELGVKVDPARCSDCGACVRVCPMDIRTVGDRECVHCGKCISVCGQKAISFRAGKLVLMGPELPERRLQK
jgi:ferredoxin